MKRIWSWLLAYVLLFAGNPVSVTAAQAPKEPQELYARSAVLMDGSSGRILFGKNENEQMPMASTTKIMTCILALESGKLQETVQASSHAAAQPEVKLGMREGEQYLLEDLLYSLMLESHNDSAVAIAEHIGGSVEEFAGMMNGKAAALGCKKTYYVTPNGLDGSRDGREHSTTAYELAKVMAYCVNVSPEREEFLKITQTRSYQFSDVSGVRSFSCQNHNAFLDMMDGVISGKTGFTSAAGYCYVCALEREGRLFIVALLACGWPYNKTYKWSDTRALMTYGTENYRNCKIQKTAVLPAIPVTGGIDGSGNPWILPEVTVEEDDADVTDRTYLLRGDEKIVSRLTIRKSLEAPVRKGAEVGRVEYYLGDELLEVCPVVTCSRIERKKFTHWMSWVRKRYLL